MKKLLIGILSTILRLPDLQRALDSTLGALKRTHA